MPSTVNTASAVSTVTYSPSLSPSRASLFMQCALRYRFQVIDRLAEPASPAAVRGTLVHAVLERLFDLEPAERSLLRACDLVRPAWEDLLVRDERVAALFGADEDPSDWLAGADGLLARYFQMEDPARYEPAEREMLVEADLPSGVRLRGYVDRLDIAPDGRLRVVDYKTGKAPSESFEGRALFQMKFYALVLWRVRGVVPTVLKLMYLGDGRSLEYSPDEADLISLERKLDALSQAIEQARDTGVWQPSKSRLCGWCAHQSLCPEFGGTPPSLSAAASS